MRYEHRIETVPVRGSKPVTMDFKWTVWGPVVADGTPGRPLVYHWSADDPASTNLGLIGLEDAANVRDAVDVAHHAGIPVLNFVVADGAGQIAWTLAGQIPKRHGYDGRLPVTWLYGDRRWEGFLPSAEVPTVMAPADGRLWNGQQQDARGRSLELLGDAGYDSPGARPPDPRRPGRARRLAGRSRPRTSSACSSTTARFSWASGTTFSCRP